MSTPFDKGMAGQFTPYGDGYVYREGGKGPALPCTAAERDRFLRYTGQTFGAAVILFMAGVIGAAVLTAHFYPTGNEPGGFVLMGGALVLIVACLYLGIGYAMHAPSRALAGRAPVDVGRPPPG